MWHKKLALGVMALTAFPLGVILPHSYNIKDYRCMVDNLYHEARGEGVIGMGAVASVVLNRAKQKHKSICDVVYQHKQFSWVGKRLSKRGNLHDVFIVATHALDGTLFDVTGGATHYHSAATKPKWTKHMVFLVRINNHIFYKEK